MHQLRKGASWRKIHYQQLEHLLFIHWAFAAGLTPYDDGVMLQLYVVHKATCDDLHACDEKTQSVEINETH